ncbi:hypothetical protein HW555_008750 [Spodoptera exigua]|uniref:Uncharacterized protein n=1 Tax=Spodoptera exigua TaxID=7107 RepID=A0A835GDR7_SPOEX|nr:hypothetical protein HW555_008750 [Spodoptera exigua]
MKQKLVTINEEGKATDPRRWTNENMKKAIEDVIDFRSDAMYPEECSIAMFMANHMKENQNTVFGCYLGRTNCLVGIDMMYKHNFNAPPKKISGNACQNYLKFVKFVERNLRYGGATKRVSFLTSLGMFLKPKYRNAGFEEHMLTVRLMYAKKYRIRFIGGAFSGERIQRIAYKLKFRDLKPSKVEITEENAEENDLGYLCGAGILPIKLLAATKVYRNEDWSPIRRQSRRCQVTEPATQAPSTSYSSASDLFSQSHFH